METATIKEVPNKDALKKWLQERGLETTGWGEGNTKDVGKFWKEIKEDESGLELWKKSDGSLQPVRVTHVLRAKVCSPQSRDRQVFLFNTWQQYGDGRKRTRNGLLSEKLTISEMPLEDHLHEVCERAVTQEEMQRVEDATLSIHAGRPAPVYDPKYKCPLKVVEEYFIDHTIEVEVSKSYPGLLTMYHLYTVDIVCTGLPTVDFNTLEFDHEDEQGKRDLKYVHAWVWLGWSQIQRYLFEGSKLKERKTKGSFDSAAALRSWLEQFNLDLSMWGKNQLKSVDSLYEELEQEETHLELWGRHDGVPLLMRVLHVMQLKIRSDDPHHAGMVLLRTWQQKQNERTKVVNRILAKTLSMADLPFQNNFSALAEEYVASEFSHILDPYFQLTEGIGFEVLDGQEYEVVPTLIEFEDHHVDVEESPSFKGMCTLYHLYTVEIECSGLPLVDFATVEVKGGKGSERRMTRANGWRWVTWQQSLDILHARTQATERRCNTLSKRLEVQRGIIDGHSEAMSSLDSALGKGDVTEATKLVREMQTSYAELQRVAKEDMDKQREEERSFATRLPPNMISKLMEQVQMDSQFIEEGKHERAKLGAELAEYRRTLSKPKDGRRRVNIQTPDQTTGDATLCHDDPMIMGHVSSQNSSIWSRCGSLFNFLRCPSR